MTTSQGPILKTEFTGPIVEALRRGDKGAQDMAQRLITDELRDIARVPMEGTPGQQAAMRAAQLQPAIRLRVDVDVKARRVHTRHIAFNGQVLYDHEAKARRHMRIHLLAGHVDVVEPYQFVTAAMANNREGVAHLHAIGGHGQITPTDVPLSGVLRLERLR